MSNSQKGNVKNPTTDDRVKSSNENKYSQKKNNSNGNRGGHTNPENQHDSKN